MARRGLWLGSLLVAAAFAGCVTNHDALEKKPAGRAGSSAGGSSGSAGGFSQLGGFGGEAANGGGHADDEPPGESVLPPPPPPPDGLKAATGPVVPGPPVPSG